MVQQTIVTKVIVRSLGTPRKSLSCLLWFSQFELINIRSGVAPVLTAWYQFPHTQVSELDECLTPVQITAMSEACGFKYRQEHFSRVA